eukprot:g976.t1
MSYEQCEANVVQMQTIDDESETKNERLYRSRNPGTAPIDRRLTTAKTLKKAQSFPLIGSFQRLHSGLKDAFPLRRQRTQPEKVINRRSSIPGAFKARKRRSTIGNIINGIVPLGLSSLVSQDIMEDDEDLWFTTVDDFDPPIYILERQVSYPYPTASILRHLESLSDLDVKRVRRSVGFMEWLRHPNIIKCYGAWETETAFYIVEEYCYRANLYRQIITNKKSLTEKHIVLNVLQPLLDALVYLHGMGVVHRGIFPGNIQFSKTDNLRLSGFIYAIDSNKSRPTSRQGPLDYSPPEVLILPDQSPASSSTSSSELEDRESHSSEPITFDERIDVWQIGVLTYEMLNGTCPFEVPDRCFSSKLILWADLHAFPQDFSPGAVSFLSQALEKIPSRRPTMEELANHPWLSSFDGKESSMVVSPAK